MKLAAYLEREKLSGVEFSRRTGLSQGMISLLASGKAWVSRGTAERIHAATNGEVTPNDLFFEATE